MATKQVVAGLWTAFARQRGRDPAFARGYGGQAARAHHSVRQPELNHRALRLVADNGGEAALEIAGFSGRGWQSAHLFIPHGARSVQLVAEAGPEGRWLAFTLPVEVGRGSWLARQARKQDTLLTAAGTMLFLFGLFVTYHREMNDDSDRKASAGDQ